MHRNKLLESASSTSFTVAFIGVLAQVEAADGGMLSDWIVWLPILAVIFVLFLWWRARRTPTGERPEITERKPPAEEAEAPTRDVLEKRMEVEEPVEITDDMSLAEIKRLKSARVKGKGKAKRETAVEATERARREAEEAEKATAEARRTAEAAEEAIEEIKEAEKSLPPAEEEAKALPAAEEAEEAKKLPPTEAEAEPADELPPAETEAAGELPAPEAAKPEALPPAAEEAGEEAAAEAEVAEPEVAEAEAEAEAIDDEEQPKPLSQGLEKTRSGFIDRLSSFFSRDELDENVVDDIEEVLFTADIGPHVAQQIIETIERRLEGEDKRDPRQIWGFIRQYTKELLERHEEPLNLEGHKPFVMLVVGVNGVGKTTTIGKLASKYRKEGKSVLLVAGDTFRAGAVDQLAVWAERSGFPVHEGEAEADPSSVLYDGIKRGMDDGVDVILCDTSGRLHTNVNLMDELAKMNRVAGKAMEGAPHETILVLDANTGQNAISQAKKFDESLEITGLVLTKLDGTAKGGVILGLCDELEAPVRYIGIGERVVDLREFDADEFVEALFM